MIQNEFVFSFGRKEYDPDKKEYVEKVYSIEDLAYFEEATREENRTFWDNVKRGYVQVFMQKPSKYESEPKQVLIAKMPVEDALKKFG